MSEFHTERMVAGHEVHIHYLGRGQRTIESRLRTVEDTQRQHTTILASQQDTAKRLQQVEKAVRLIKAGIGLVLGTLSATGSAGQVGEKAARIWYGML